MKATTTSWEGLFLADSPSVQVAVEKSHSCHDQILKYIIYSFDNLTTLKFESILFATTPRQDSSGLNNYHKSNKCKTGSHVLYSCPLSRIKTLILRQKIQHCNEHECFRIDFKRLTFLKTNDLKLKHKVIPCHLEEILNSKNHHL